MADDDEQWEVEDEGATGVRTEFDPGDLIEDEPLDEAALRVAFNTLDELVRRVRRIEEHLRIADN